MWQLNIPLDVLFSFFIYYVKVLSKGDKNEKKKLTEAPENYKILDMAKSLGIFTLTEFQV